jgi:Na+/H+-dicarboxylate symporter
MIYLMGQLWLWLLLAFAIGVFVGWSTCGQKAR